jgi:hypothetical protein
MKRMFVLTLAIAALMMGTIIVSAQQGQRIVYQTVGFANVAPDKTAAYIDFQKNTVSKIIRERMNTEQILGWTVYQVVYRGLPASEYNFATVTTYSSPPSQAGQGVVQKATGMSPAEIGTKFGPLATNVGNMLNRAEAGTGPISLQEGNVTTVVTWKITPQRGADYGRYVQTMLLPLNAQGVKDGRFLSWGASRVVSPGGADAPFDAITATTYKDLASALPTTAPDPNQGQMNFTKVFPNQNFSAFVDQGREVRRNVRTQMLRAVTSLQRPTTTSSR